MGGGRRGGLGGAGLGGARESLVVLARRGKDGDAFWARRKGVGLPDRRGKGCKTGRLQPKGETGGPRKGRAGIE